MTHPQGMGTGAAPLGPAPLGPALVRVSLQALLDAVLRGVVAPPRSAG